VTVLVDYTHVHRKVTGIERISLELFSKDALSPLSTQHVRARSVPDMIRRQWIDLPLTAARDRDAVVLCPGFPPSATLQVASRKLVTYVHDLFLVTQVETLSRNARFYLRPSFLRMLGTQRYFLTNSASTMRALAAVALPGSLILLYRPVVRNLFGLEAANPEREASPVLTFLAMGTVEPRKNYRYAAEIVEALNARGVAAKLRIIGRVGWGPDAEDLSRRPHVELLGHLTDDEVRRIVASADCILCTSLDEGLGLPLVELQYAGLPTAVVDLPVFREILAGGSTVLPKGNAAGAAEAIAAASSHPQWRRRGRDEALRILSTYNGAAERDRDAVIGFLGALEREPATAEQAYFARRVF
jgi:glycosyltransferase involved in cell wall biosynthesis